MTLDEAANRHANEGWKTMDGKQTGDINPVKWASFVSGANWQDQQSHLERYETRLALHKLIKWAKAVESSKAPILIENCEKILNKWSNIKDALR